MARPLGFGRGALVATVLLALAATLSAQDNATAADGLSWSVSGNAGPSIELSFPWTGASKIDSPKLEELGASAHLGLKASSSDFLLRAGLDAAASADSFSPVDNTTTTTLALRELELSWLPDPSFALRAGKLLRSLGLGQAGSPADPFAVMDGQGGFWGLETELTGGTALSALGLLSIDRAATAGELPSWAGTDGAMVARLSTGALDAALGAYLHGDIERRAVANLSLPLLGFLATAGGGLAFPASSWHSAQGAIRAGLERGFGIGNGSAELGLAWRQSWPGRNSNEVTQLAQEVASAAVSGTKSPYAPFAPYWGSSYVECALSLESDGALSLSAGLVAEPDFASLGWQLEAEAWTGDLRFYVQGSGTAGGADSEFVAVAQATGQPALDLKAGVGISF